MDHPRSNEGVTLNILAHLDFKQRFAARLLSREWGSFAGDDYFARWLCLQLQEEARVYCPPRPPPGVNWRTVFKDLWSRRLLWAPSEDNDEGNGNINGEDGTEITNKGPETDSTSGSPTDDGSDSSKAVPRSPVKKKKLMEATADSINVLVRFRPKQNKPNDASSSSAAGDTAAEGGKAFFLPLHQRLQLIRSRDAAKKKRQAKEKAALKASSGAAAAAAAAASSEKEEEEETPAEKAAAEKASRRAALQSLTSEGGWFGSDWKKAPASAGGGADEGAAEDATDGSASQFVAHVHEVDPLGGRVVAVAPGVGLREFSFDHVFPANCSQSAVYEAATRRLLTDFLNGVNGTILVYGQTGSGKTYTMFGDQAGLATPPAPAAPAAAASATSTAVAPIPSVEANELVKNDDSTPAAAEDETSAAAGAGTEERAGAGEEDLSVPTPLVSPMRGAGAGAARKIKSSSAGKSPADDEDNDEDEEEDSSVKKINYDDNNKNEGDSAAFPVVQEAVKSDLPAVTAGASAAEGAAAAGGEAVPVAGGSGGGTANTAAAAAAAPTPATGLAPALKEVGSGGGGASGAVKPLKRGAQARGVVPRAAEEVLLAGALKRKLGIDAEVTASYVEVFGDEVTDLLRSGAKCGHSKVAAQRYVLSGATGVQVESVDDVEHLLAKGDAQKRRAATAMNARSSRAHALFILTLTQRDVKDPSKDAAASSKRAASDRVITSQLYLADLGGSEQVKRSQVAHGTMTATNGFVLGDQMREAVYINLGLLALKKCIEALNSKSEHVPYQDSKLTMLLSSALGGNSKASVVVCGSMDASDAKETVQALRFGEACGKVENRANVGARGAAAGLLATLEAQIEELEATIKAKERWENVEVFRKDDRIEDGSVEAAVAKLAGGESIKTGKIVGAEKERELLEAAVLRRAALLGEEVESTMAESGFGGLYGGQASATGGSVGARYAQKSAKGLQIKGKVIAEWVE